MKTNSQSTQHESNEITINILINRQLAALLIVAMLAIAAAASLAWDSKPVEASSPEAPALVRFRIGRRLVIAGNPAALVPLRNAHSQGCPGDD